jgi:chromosome partitioning protein
MPVQANNPYRRMQAPEVQRLIDDGLDDFASLQLIEDAFRDRRTDASVQLHSRVSQLIERALTDEQRRSTASDFNEFDVFLSYSHADEAKATALRDELKRLGLKVWHDRERLDPGVNYHERIAHGIRASKSVLVVCSASVADSQYVRHECTYAFERNKPITPYRVDNAPLPEIIEFYTTGIQWIDATTGLPRDDLRRWKAVVQPVGRSGIVVAVMNMKGGVGKTTLAANVFGTLNQLKDCSVLMLDLDPQANLSQLLLPKGAHEEHMSMSASSIALFEPEWFSTSPGPGEALFEIKRGYRTAFEATQLAVPLRGFGANAARFDLIPGQFEVVKYGLPFAQKKLDALSSNFKRFISKAKEQYDFIVMDAGPTASFVHQCMIDNASHVLCPIRPDKYSFEGVAIMDRLLKDVFKKHPAPKLRFLMNGVDIDSNGEWGLKRQRQVYEHYVEKLHLSGRMIGAVVPETGLFQASVEAEVERPTDVLGINNPRIDRSPWLREQIVQACDEVMSWTASA